MAVCFSQVALRYPNSEELVAEQRAVARADLRGLLATRSRLAVRQESLAQFLGRCDATAAELELRLAELSRELAAVRATEATAAALYGRIQTETGSLRYSAVNAVLNLVLHGGWLGE